jgi:hypothetical protein
MTRTYNFTLADSTRSYNLWNDLITKQSSFDPTMSNFPYTPKIVQSLKVYFPIAGVNSLNNAGNNVSIMGLSGREKQNLISDSLFEERTDRNAVDLSHYNLQGSAANVQIDISVVAV